MRDPNQVPGALPSPETIATWIEEVEAARIAHPLSPDQRIRALGRIGEVLADPASAARRRALRELPEDSGLSPEAAAQVLDRMAETWRPASLARLWDEEFQHWCEPSPIDARPGPSAGPAGQKPAASGGAARREPDTMRPLSPQLHIGPGSVPGVTLTSAVRGLLSGAAVVSKPGASDTVLTHLGREILQEERAELAARWVAAYWPGAVDTIQLAARSARLVVVYGDDATVAAYRDVIPEGVRMVAYGHRASAAVVGESMANQASAAQLAEAVAAYDRRGCVSPQVAYLVGGSTGGAAQHGLWSRGVEWGGWVADALADLEARMPLGPRGAGVTATALQLVGDIEMRAAAGERLRAWTGAGAKWCVVANGTGAAVPLPAGRSVQVIPVHGLRAATAALETWGSVLQSVGLCVEPSDRAMAENVLRATGALRVVSLPELPWPPAWWVHDGQRGLTPLMARLEQPLRSC